MSSTLDIIWLGHSSFEVRLSTGGVILIDPWFDGNPSYPKDHQLDRVDAVLVTHGHPDISAACWKSRNVSRRPLSPCTRSASGWGPKMWATRCL